MGDGKIRDGEGREVRRKRGREGERKGGWMDGWEGRREGGREGGREGRKKKVGRQAGGREGGRIKELLQFTIIKRYKWHGIFENYCTTYGADTS